MTIGAVIFDSSGTIIDDIFAVWLADLAAYKFFGYKFAESVEGFKEIFKMPIPEFYRATGVPADMMQKVNRAFRKFYAEFNVYNSIFPDVKEVLAKLKQENMKLGVASNTPRAFLKEHLQRFAILDYFDAITGQEDCDEQKPSPKPIQVTLKKLGIKPEHAMYVGDMEEDMIAGKSANVITVAINRKNSYHPMWKVKRQNPDHLISDLNELLAIMRGLEGLPTKGSHLT